MLLLCESKRFNNFDYNIAKGVNLDPSPWAPGPLFIKPPFRGAPNEGAKKKSKPPKPPL